MHRLRFEPYIEYSDLQGYVSHLNTYAKEANAGVIAEKKRVNPIKRIGQALGLAFAQDNPRTLVKNAHKPIGNLPQEILIHLQVYMESLFENKTLTPAVFQQQSSKCIVNHHAFLYNTNIACYSPPIECYERSFNRY
jgi:putative membrane protein